MKIRHLAPLFLLIAAATTAFAQSTATPPAHAHQASTEPAAADVKAFERLKTLAGSWVGTLTTTPAIPAMAGSVAQFSLRVTSRGNALLHEMSVSGLPDHPVTMFYLEGGRLGLTHYCDAGNRPRMTGRMSPDGKSLEFDFLDLSGADDHGHMHRAVFTFIDDNRHTEDWTFMMPGGMAVRAHFDLRRTTFEGAAAR